MKREHFSAAVALDLEGAEAPQGEPYSDAVTQASGHVGKLVSRFHAAAEEQVSAHAALAARIDRLEDNQTANELRQAMRELHSALSGLVSETSSSIIRIEDRIVAVAETVTALGASTESANNAFRHLSVSAHEKIAGLGELLNSTIQRVEQGEKSAAELKAAETGVCASITSLSEKLDLLRDKLAEEQKETRQLGEQLRLAGRHIANFLECEGRVGALENRESEQRKFVHSLSEKHDVLRDKLAEEQKETSRLGEHLRLAEHQIANFPVYEARVRALESQESELRQVVKSLREIQGQSDQMSADVCTLSEGLRSLHAEVDSVSARHGDLKTRVEQAEIGLSSSLEQSQSLARLHARLAETYSAR